MKSAGEILDMLKGELIRRSNASGSNSKSRYMNQYLGDTSFLLARLLQQLLQANFSEWKPGKWIDDSFIRDFFYKNRRFFIKGDIVWANDATDQWVSAFAFELELSTDEANVKDFVFYFVEQENPEMMYEEYENRRNFWSRPINNWKYVITLQDMEP